jgi:hypothetical protein
MSSTSSPSSSASQYVDLAKRAGFDENVADPAKLKQLLSTASKKALDTVQMVTSACGQKSTATEEHFRLLARLTPVLSSSATDGSKGGSKKRSASASPSKKSGKGGSGMHGGTSMPLQYFGVEDRGNYATEFGDMGHAPWSDQSLTRTGVPASPPFMGGGGGAGVISDSMLTGFVKEYNQTGTSRIRLNEGARNMLKRVIAGSVIEGLRAERPSGSGGKKRLTNAIAEKAKQKLRVRFTATTA